MIEPYSPEFNKKLKAIVKDRDLHTCQECGSKKNLIVHHIDYDKKGIDIKKMITLCRSCKTLQ